MRPRPRWSAAGLVAAAGAAAVLVAGTGAPAAALSRPAPSPAPVDRPGRPDTTDGDTIDSRGDSAVAAHAAQLDSLRERAAVVRAALLRLRVEYRVRLHRRHGTLRIDLPATVGADAEPTVAAGAGALERAAGLLSRYYPEADVSVVGRAAGDGHACGSPEARRRAEAAVRHLTGPGGLDPARVDRGDCERLAAPDSRPAAPGAAGGEPGVVLLVRPGNG